MPQLDQQLHVRLADYGFEYVKREVRRTGQTLGCEYNAPEQLEHGPAYSTADAVDVYSICIIVNQYVMRHNTHKHTHFDSLHY